MLERVVDEPPELIREAWTTPVHLMMWSTPAPWKTVDCEIDLSPGGKFYTLMESPEGQQVPNTACYPENMLSRRLAWTDALLPGHRPANVAADAPFVFTAIIEIEPHGSGTKYTATSLHSTEEGRAKHETLDFHTGWGAALDQLVELARNWRPRSSSEPRRRGRTTGSSTKPSRAAPPDPARRGRIVQRALVDEARTPR